MQIYSLAFVIAVVLAVLVWIGSLYRTESVLRAELAKEVETTQKCKLSNSEYKQSIEDNNKRLEVMQDTQEKLKSQYLEELNKPPDIRYRDRIVEVKSDDCKDIKLELDRIRTRGVLGN
jgi:hypothetical protein